MMDNVDDALAEQASEQEKATRQGEVHALLQKVDFALQVRSFLASEIGERILSDAEKETRTLLDDLASLDPDDEVERKTIRAIRQRLALLAHWQDRFAEYIAAGNAAEVELNEGEGHIQPE